MNRLESITRNPRRSALATVLDHLKDSHPDEYMTALYLLEDTAHGHTQVADALTAIAREDGLGVRVTEKSIRDHRKAINAN